MFTSLEKLEATAVCHSAQQQAADRFDNDCIWFSPLLIFGHIASAVCDNDGNICISPRRSRGDTLVLVLGRRRRRFSSLTR